MGFEETLIIYQKDQFLELQDFEKNSNSEVKILEAIETLVLSVLKKFSKQSCKNQAHS